MFYNKKAVEYVNYIKEHIKNVNKACEKYGLLICKELDIEYEELCMQIKSHDKSKFSSEEFNAYRQKFYRDKNEEEISENEFNKAWLHHIHNNPHHPEYWVYYCNNNLTESVTVFDMSNNYIAEMILDWVAMGYKFNDRCYDYYNKEGKNKLLSPVTRSKLEQCLGLIKKYDLNNGITFI